MRRTQACAMLTLAAALPTAALAQSAPKAPAPPGSPPPTTTAPAPPAAEAPPYEPQLLRLAEILGTLSFMRDLCGDNDGAEWRRRMAALIAAEGKTESRKEELAGAFNRGFRGYELTYRTCTAAAHTVITRLLEEGGHLAHDITGR